MLNGIWIYAKYDLLGGGKMNITDYLKDEMKRLNRMNDNLEKNINKELAINNEPEQVVNNVKAMCEIANTICNLHGNCII